MICKKCGKKYEDDMPNCLWCNTPNDSLTSNSNEISTCKETPNTPDAPPQESEEIKPAEIVKSYSNICSSENVKRGQSAILWLKISIVFLVVFFISSEILISVLPNSPEEAAKAAEALKETKAVPPKVLLSFFITFLCLIPLSICSCIYIYKACAWFYHAEKNLRQFTKTKFTPSRAVIYTATCILDYFIYKDLLHHQKEVLQKYNLKFSTVSNKVLMVILTLSFIYVFFIFADVLFIIRLLSLILMFPLVICHIKAMRAVIENEQQLDTKLFDDMVNRKVEERMTERNRG